MQFEVTKRTVDHYELPLPSAAGRTEVDSAFEVVSAHRYERFGPDVLVEMSVVDGRIVVGYAVATPAGVISHERAEQCVEAEAQRYQAERLLRETESSRDELRHLLDNARTRLEYARGVLVMDGYFAADEINDDIAPRLGEWLSHHRGRMESAEAKVARAAALAEKWGQARYIALKDTGRDDAETHVRPLHEAADLLLAALADTKDGA